MGRILIVDDAAAIRQVVNHVLTSQGHQVTEAVDGLDGLSKLSGDGFDLIVCDVNMPNMDGIQFLKTVKTDKEYASYRFTPFVMLTTESNDKMKAAGKEAGAKAWLIKPFQPNALLDAVKKLI